MLIIQITIFFLSLSLTISTDDGDKDLQDNKGSQSR